ncbi:hypothetical protein OKW41_000519 [Paraburkholderia sp. UCT70]
MLDLHSEAKTGRKNIVLEQFAENSADRSASKSFPASRVGRSRSRLTYSPSRQRSQPAYLHFLSICNSRIFAKPHLRSQYETKPHYRLGMRKTRGCDEKASESCRTRNEMLHSFSCRVPATAFCSDRRRAWVRCNVWCFDTSGRHCKGGDMTAWTRREMLHATALAVVAAVSAKVHAQHGNMGPVRPPVRLTDVSVVDQTGTTRTLEALLREGITAVQTIYTGCGSVCPLQGALFSAVQDRMLQARTRYPIRLLSIGIDPFGDVPSALRAWLLRFNAGPRCGHAGAR